MRPETCDSTGIDEAAESMSATDQTHTASAGRPWAVLWADCGFICLFLGLLTLAVYWPVKNCEFIAYDDPLYVVSNPHLKPGLTLDGVLWALGSGRACNWHPLTWLSLMVDVSLFGIDPAGSHLVNLLLHVMNTLLLFLVLRQFTGARWRSAFVAAIFAMHPLHVESVAWISERKDVLSGLFWLLTLGAYGRYVRKRSTAGNCGSNPVGTPAGRLWSFDYVLVVLFFVLGLMSKPMLVTLPLVLLLLDYWPLGRWTLPRPPLGGSAVPPSDHSGPSRPFSTLVPLLREKVPLFALSGISCLVTFLVQGHGGAIAPLERIPIGARVENAFVACARYLGKAFWPAGLAIPYPHPVHWPIACVVLAVLLVAGLSAAALWTRRKLPFVVVGWLWFLVTLTPVIGLVQVGVQSMADRYTYIPLVGVFILVAWGAEAAFARWRLPKVVPGILAVSAISACAIVSVNQLRYWQNTETLFRHSIEVTTDNYVAYENLGLCLYHKGQPDPAAECYRRAIQINPDDCSAYDNLGQYWYDRGSLDKAIEEYRQALRIYPDYPNAWNDLGCVLTRRRQLTDAIQCFQRALHANPDYAEAHDNLGVALDAADRTDEAIGHYTEALRLQPDNLQAHNNLANALFGRGQVDEAIRQYHLALGINPGFTPALNNLGWALFSRGQYAEAISCYEQALKLRPEDERLHLNLAHALAKTSQDDAAIAHYAAALRLAPADAEAHLGLGRILAKRGHRDEAVNQLKEALRLQPDSAEVKRELQALGGLPD